MYLPCNPFIHPPFNPFIALVAKVEVQSYLGDDASKSCWWQYIISLTVNVDVYCWNGTQASQTTDLSRPQQRMGTQRTHHLQQKMKTFDDTLIKFKSTLLLSLYYIKKFMSTKSWLESINNQHSIISKMNSHGQTSEWVILSMLYGE